MARYEPMVPAKGTLSHRGQIRLGVWPLFYYGLKFGA